MSVSVMVDVSVKFRSAAFILVSFEKGMMINSITHWLGWEI